MRHPVVFRSAPRRPPGFSLAEVAIALGILAFVLISVLGLTASSLRQIRQSEDESRLADLVQKTLLQVRAELAADADFQAPPSPWQSDQRVLHFNSEGVLLEGNAPTNAYYQVTASLSGPPSSLPHLPANSLKSLRLQIGWPWHGGSSNTDNTRSYSLLLRNRSRP